MMGNTDKILEGLREPEWKMECENCDNILFESNELLKDNIKLQKEKFILEIESKRLREALEKVFCYDKVIRKNDGHWFTPDELEDYEMWENTMIHVNVALGKEGK